MTNRSRRSAADRAEARRRSRLAAQGREIEEETDSDVPPASAASRPAGGSFLTRLFPPAPPLPGKGDPLAGFTYVGPMRGLVSSFHLLARNPTPWIAMGALWSVGRLMTVGTVVGIIASLIAFGALIAAGWLGWQRPWLFGLMASIVGILLFAGIRAALLATNTDQYTASEVVIGTIYLEAIGFQPLFGALAGWYGGYLRRRMAATSAAARRPNNRRR